MIPQNDFELSGLEIQTAPSKNYKMLIADERINGYSDELEAMKQTVYKILNTERYQYLIYSWDYGIELSDLYGEPVDYICAELQRRIAEALTQDDRIDGVSDFVFDTSKKGVVRVSFNVHTIFGSFDNETEVTV